MTISSRAYLALFIFASQLFLSDVGIDLLYFVGEVPAWATFWYSIQTSFLGSLFYEDVPNTRCSQVNGRQPSKTGFRSWGWKVVKAISNAFQDTVSDLYCVLLFVCLYFLSHLLSFSSLL
jgi:hypothetical protein